MKELSTINSPDDLNERLLRLLPVKPLREEFSPSTNKHYEMILEILGQVNLDVLKDYVFRNFNYTKQHIQVFEHNIRHRDIMSLESSFFPYKCYRKTPEENGVSFFYFHKLQYEIILDDPLESTLMSFIWPFKLTLEEKYAIIQYTIIEKKIDSYLHNNRNIVFSKRAEEENQITDAFLSYLKNLGSIHTCDLTKGVKQLWEDDLIDSRYVRWKKSKSTTTEAMDESYTLKTAYPDVYHDLINKPLTKTTFKNIKADNFCSYFSVEPSDGKIIVPLFPKQLTEINNVIETIIKNN
jgi:hypothetical protein